MNSDRSAKKFHHTAYLVTDFRHDGRDNLELLRRWLKPIPPATAPNDRGRLLDNRHQAHDHGADTRHGRGNNRGYLSKYRGHTPKKLDAMGRAVDTTLLMIGAI